MSATNKNKVLITALYYPPCALIGAKRPFKMAGYLAGAGWDVTVLTVEPRLTPPSADANDDSARVKVVRTGAFVPFRLLKNLTMNRDSDADSSAPSISRQDKLRSKFFQKTGKIIKKIVRSLLTSFDKIDDWSGWRKSALKAIKSESNAFDIIISTIPPHSTAFLGRQLASFYNCKLVLDYRDPWCEILESQHALGECSNKKLARNYKIENECLESADLILTVSPAITEMLTKRVDKNILTVPQGFVGRAVESSFDEKNMYVLYAGALAYGRDISPVLLAIKHCVEKYGKDLKLLYFGEDFDLANLQASKVGAADYLEVRRVAPADEVTQYARKALCNIVVISPGYEYQYPGKIFDLIPAGRPIYVVSENPSEAGRLIEQYGLGGAIVGDDFVELGEKIRGEIDSEFRISSKVNELGTNSIYMRMVDEGLSLL